MRRISSAVAIITLLLILSSTAWGKSASSSSGELAGVERKVQVREFLSPSKERLGIAVAYLERELLVQGAVSSPNHLALAQSFVVPNELRGSSPVIQKVRLSEHSSALWVRYEISSDRFYSFIFLGAWTGSDLAKSGQAQLVLKGWSTKGDSSLQLETTKFGHRFVLRTGEVEVGCGRRRPKKTLILDHRTTRFRSAKLSFLSRAERESARIQAVEPARLSDDDRTLRVKHRQGDREPSDGDRTQIWDRSYEVSEFSLPSSANQNEILLHLGASSNDANRIFLALEGDLLALDLTKATPGVFSVSLPEGEHRCLALIQPRRAASVIEVMARGKKRLSLDELARSLDTSSPEHALSVLGLMGKEGSRGVAKKFVQFGRVGRRRALDLAESLPGESGADIYIAAVELGSEEERNEAQRALVELGPLAVDSVAERFSSSGAASEARLARALSAVAPRRAARLIFRKLNQPSGARRSELRRVVSDLFGSERGKRAILEILSEQVRVKRMSRSSSSEVIRALRPALASLATETVPVVQRLATTASFREAYRLLPAVAALLEVSETAREIYGRWLVGSVWKKISDVESAALSVRALEVLEDDAKKERQVFYEDRVTSLFQSKNVRVRVNALRLATLIANPQRYDDVHELLKDDAWPQVRVAAAEALGAFGKLPATQLSGDKRAELGGDLADQVTDEDDPKVRRVITRALSRVKTQEATEALREVLLEDDDYKVRSEAALSLGRVCDRASIDDLTELAHGLAQGLSGDGPILLGLAATTALVQLNPVDLQKRLKPLMSKNVPGPIRVRIDDRMRRVKRSGCQK